MMTKEQKELKKKLEELEIDKFLIDEIIKFHSITIGAFLRKGKGGE